MPEPFAVLLVMGPDRLPHLMRALQPMDADVVTAATCDEALEVFRRDGRVRVLVTAPSLPDAAWRDLLHAAREIRPEAKVVVCSPLGDARLWIDVLEAGGFDVLAEPFVGWEVKRIVLSAATRRAAA